jgi:hypothetical protein
MKIYYENAGLIIRDAEIDDIDKMKDNLREADKQEIWASDHHTPEKALWDSYHLSTEKMVAVFNGELVAMFGIVPVSLLDNKAVVWMLTTNAIEKMPLRFLKLSKKFIGLLRERYSMLFNFVDARHKKSIDWLNWCGASFFPPQDYGVEHLPFQQFVFGGQ